MVATRNATTVTIVPSADGGGHSAGVPYTVSMNLGDVYELSGQMPDVTGTSISSDKPVAVLGGHQCANIPLVDGVAPGSCDHIVEEIPPTPTWGQHFVTMPLATRTRGEASGFQANFVHVVVPTSGTASVRAPARRTVSPR